jgi:hypothetical protein
MAPHNLFSQGQQFPDESGDIMEDITFEIVEEQVSSLDSLGVDEGCSTTTTSSSLDISEVEFE